MAWVIINKDLVISRMALTERTAFDSIDVNSGEPSRLNSVIYYVSQFVRGKIAISPAVRSDMGPGPSGSTPGTIPDELVMAALNIIRYELFSGLPVGETILDKNRIKDYEDARDDIQKVADDEMSVVGASQTGYLPESSIVGGKYQIGWLGRTRPSTFVEDNPPQVGPASGTGPFFKQ